MEAKGVEAHHDELAELSRRRWRVAGALTAAMLVVYFGFILLVAYGKSALGTLVVPGLSVGILLGALVIVVAWALTGVYVVWANRKYDVDLARVKARILLDAASRDEASS